jgi:hypothetical protein
MPGPSSKSYRAWAAVVSLLAPLLLLAQTGPPKAIGPRVEVIGPKQVVLRFDPRLIHDRHVIVRSRPGALQVPARTAFNYRVPVPYWVEKARPVKIEFTSAMAADAGPTKVVIVLNRLPRAVEVPDGAGGFIARISAPASPSPEIEIHIEAEGGITIYGASREAQTADPAVVVTTSLTLDKPVGWSFEDNSGEPLPPLKPFFDYAVRDTSICLGGDGNYYLTGTTGSPDMWAVTSALQLWKSPDLRTWTPVVESPRARSIVWDVDRDGSWEKPIALRDGSPFRPLWAPEIHYLKGTYWFTYSLPGRGVGLLKSQSGKPEGPYAKAFADDQPVADGIDASLFEDTGGKVYYLYGGGRIARIKDDMSGLAEPFHSLTPANAPYVGFEGVYLFRANGKYYLSAADFTFGDYHAYAATADNIYGPYSERYLAVPHGGHNVYFQDQQGAWWSSFFGNDSHSPWRERPAALRIAFDPDGRIRVANPQP